MEGDPYALDDEHGSGLEYLFGVIELDPAEDGGVAPRYRSFWAHDRAEEQRAFEDFVDFVMKRRAEFPDLHVYHYAPYEPSAVKRLMGQHHTREAEVDELLRAEVFVDLYAVVRSSVRIGTESYSLKQVEKLSRVRCQTTASRCSLEHGSSQVRCGLVPSSHLASHGTLERSASHLHTRVVGLATIRVQVCRGSAECRLIVAPVALRHRTSLRDRPQAQLRAPLSARAANRLRHA
jgi:hypothetical protein